MGYVRPAEGGEAQRAPGRTGFAICGTVSNEERVGGATMLTIAVALLGFSFPLHNWRAVPGPPGFERATQRVMRRAPLAEHKWEESVLMNLTSSEPSWE